MIKGKHMLAVMVGVGVGLTALGPAGAMASTDVSSFGPGPVVVAGPMEANQITLTQTGATLVITDAAGVTDSDDECVQDNANQVSCTGTSLPFHVSVTTGDLNDQVVINSVPFVDVWGGEGDDLLDASNGQGQSGLGGGPGDDTMIAPQAGDSARSLIDSTLSIFSASGARVPVPGFDLGDDTMKGGPGADQMSGRGADVMDGGGGMDNIEGTAHEPDCSVGINPCAGYPVDDGAVDQITCGEEYDGVYLGVGDLVGFDCDQIWQTVSCPAGASCEGTPTITAPVAGAAVSSLSATTSKKKKKETKGKQIVLGRGSKLKLGPRRAGTLGIRLRSKLVSKTLGKRALMSATFNLGLDRIRAGKRVGRTNKKVRFKLKR